MNVLGYFHQLFVQGFANGQPKADFDVDKDVYLPSTSENDIDTEVALIPNVHKRFKAITSRAYYDKQYLDYKDTLERFNINAISSFALVSPKKDKNHIGRYLLKVQRKVDDKYLYIVATIDREGQFARKSDGTLDIKLFSSNQNTILCVCEDDFKNTREKPENPGTWTPEIRDIPMVKSTTSSHYSIFRQRVPEYDLRYVRHYLQFKNRLIGMEFALEQLERDIHRKEVHASECFVNETLAVQQLFNELTKNEDVMDLVIRYYDYIAEHEQLVVKYEQLRGLRDDKLAILKDLLQKYNALSDKELDKKLELGHTIQSLKLELNKSIKAAMEAIKERIQQILSDVRDLNAEIANLQEKDKIPENAAEVLQTMKEEFCGQGAEDLKAQFRKIASQAFGDAFGGSIVVDEESPRKSEPSKRDENQDMQPVSQLDAEGDQGVLGETPDPLETIPTGNLERLIKESERWSRYMSNIGWELDQLQQMHVICEDQTIKVRRLVHNFEEQMQEVEEQVWDDNHVLREDFSFTGIASASLREIILLHDWYACNAPGKTPEEMGFTGDDKDEQFMEFRKKCNRIAYNLRKNQYAKMLAMQKVKIRDMIDTLTEKLKAKDYLRWKDKYGKDAQVQETKAWRVEDATSAQVKRINLITCAEKVLANNHQEFHPVNVADVGSQRIHSITKVEKVLDKIDAEKKEYAKDSELMKDRVVEYLKKIGLIETEDDIEALATRNKAAQYEGNINLELNKLENAKNELDKATEVMTRQRNALQSILDNILKAEEKIQKLEQENGKIFNRCLVEQNRQIRNRLLINKLENENKIVELKGIVKNTRKEHFTDLSKLEKMRKDVDRLQEEYDNSVSRFKSEIGLDENTIGKLMVGIYNKFQDEILSEDK